MKKTISLPVPSGLFSWEKLQAVSGSQNFLIGFITLIFGFLAANNLEVVDVTQVETFWQAVKTGELNLIIPIILVNFVNPIMKIVSSGGFDWQGIKNSPNFWTNIATVVLSITATFGLIIPEEALTGFLDAIVGQNASFIEIIIAFVLNLGNVFFHFFFDDDDDKLVVEDKEVEVIDTKITTKEPKKIVPSKVEA